MRHASWDELDRLIGEIAAKHGGRLADPRAGKCWDPGQAVCAEMYGPHWGSDPRFLIDSALPDSEPTPPGALEAAQRLLDRDEPFPEEAGDEGN